MWKPNSVHQKPNFSRIGICLILILAGFITACSTTGGLSTDVPTLVLIPSTITSTPLPIPPSPTTGTLVAPSDLETSTPLEETLSTDSQSQLVTLAIEDLTTRVNVSVSEIQIGYTEAVRWRSNQLDCGRATPAANLRIAGYRIVLLVDEKVYEYYGANTEVHLCQQSDLLDVSTSVLLRIDPVAAELVGLAKRRLAQELGLPEAEIQAVEVSPVSWEDSSLGCPVEGQTYSLIVTDGYRIIMQAGDDQFIFHTTFDGITLCENEPENP